MKILFTGGETGGHFYPIIAIAEELNKKLDENQLSDTKMYYMSSTPYDERLLFENKLTFVGVASGKRRLGSSIKNFFDIFKTIGAVFLALWKVFSMYPDVVVGKGGHGSFPALFAARIFRIPVIIHESDTIPGRVNKWASKFATKIAISYPEAAKHFPKEKTALTGNPIRKILMTPQKEGANEFFGLEENVPVILILGGSQGSQKINDAVVQTLSELVKNYQIIHQVGEANKEEVSSTADALLANSEFKSRYHLFGILDAQALIMSAGVAKFAITRAGSTLFELAVWGIPSIVVPIAISHGDHQRKNAFEYARSGAADVIEEQNLTPNILLSEINRLMEDEESYNKMKKSALGFAKLDAAEKIADQIVGVLVEHRK